MQRRIPQIDFLRGTAIVMMVAFHFLWDLNYFFEAGIVLTEGFWNYFRILTASLFIFVSGVSTFLFWKKKNAGILLFFKKSLPIYFSALLVTFASAWIFPDSYIVFGILHFIATAFLLLYFFRHLRFLNLILALVFIFFTPLLKDLVFAQASFLIPLGFAPHDFSSLDYYPLLPWFGVSLLGFFASKEIFGREPVISCFGGLDKNIFFKSVSFLGRNSLVIYLAHQPILFLFFYLFNIGQM